MPPPAEKKVQLAVLGAGPGGYAAAFRAADLGLSVALIERHQALGGVCLNVGCIPSKALLHVAGLISEAARAKEIGLGFDAPRIDLAHIRRWKDGVVTQLTTGLAGLAKKRKVEVVRGRGRFTSANTLAVARDGADTPVHFEQAVIAAGSAPLALPGAPQHARVMDSTAALTIADVPKRLLVVGGGIIGLEMATVYHALGSRISVVEMQDALMAGADADLVRPLFKRLSAQYENIWLGARVREMKALKSGIQIHFDGKGAPEKMTFDKVLVSVGRSPNGARIGADAAGVAVDARGFIAVDAAQRTNIPHIFAIGDIIGEPMLAHKAAHQGKVAAEAAAGMKSVFGARVIPSVAYTDPEIAWAGLTETQAKQQGIQYGKGVFPWMASGRALTQAKPEGITKLLFDPATGRLLGAGITGHHAGDLIAEAALAIEMNADAEDIGLTIHPHPTLAETLGLAAEVFGGVVTDLYAPKRPAG
ncbi:MAG: dihydrolipoyl dehydrogenase [Gammaproteobacteria bacterium]